MDPTLLAAGGGAALGLGKSIFFDMPRERRQRSLAATTERLSPWTGLHAKQVEEADPLGSVMQGGFTGAALGQGLQSAQLENQNTRFQNQWLASHSVPGAAAGSGPQFDMSPEANNLGSFWGAGVAPKPSAPVNSNAATPGTYYGEHPPTPYSGWWTRQG